MVLGHGYTACADLNFGWFADSLDGTDAVALDFRGHGQGGLRGASGTYDPENYLEKPFTITGLAAMEPALLEPEHP